MYIDFGYGCYDGGLNADNIPHGKGTITYYEPNTTIPSGKVTGEFFNGEFVGDVTVDYCNGAVYVGEYDRLEGHRKGYGVMTYTDGDKYEGEWKENARNGHGTLFFNDGNKYVGNWENDYMSGYGKYYYSNENRYEGNFLKDLFCGKGTFYYADGTKYDGGFKDDYFHGEGTLYDKDGNIIHKGNWENGEFIK